VLFSTETGPQIKDIRSGDQVDVDPASWTPPPADVRPRVIQSNEKKEQQ
jgi:histidyl-tRNA synthetase